MTNINNGVTRVWFEKEFLLTFPKESDSLGLLDIGSNSITIVYPQHNGKDVPNAPRNFQCTVNHLIGQKCHMTFSNPSFVVRSNYAKNDIINNKKSSTLS